MPHTPAPRTNPAAMLVAFMWGAYFLNYCDRQTISAMYPALRAELGFSDTELGLIGLVFLWTYGILCPIAGQLADTFSKRKLVVWSLAVWSVVTVCTGLSTSVFMLLALRAAMGVSESLYMPAAIALTANAHAPQHRSRAVSILTTAQIAGTVGGVWFGGWMAQNGMWRGAFFVLGALGILYALPYFIFLQGVKEGDELETKKSAARISASALTKIPTFWLLCVVFPLFVFGLWLLYGWLPTFFHEKFSLDLADAGFNATAFLQGSALIGLLSGGVIADWLYRRTKAARLWLLAASVFLCAPCLHALGNSATLDGTRLAAAGFGLFSGLFMGNIFPAAFEVVPADTRASAVGLLNFTASICSGLATLSGGMWKQSLGLERLMSYTALIYLAAGFILLGGIQFQFRRDYERMHSEPRT